MVKGLIVGLTSSSTESVMTATKKPNQAGLDRRAVLRGGLLALGSIGAGALRSLSADAPIEVPAYPTAPAAVGNLGRTAAAGQVDVGGGTTYHSWFFGGAYPAPTIRIREGENLQVLLSNQLPEPTSIHWHGVPLPNAMDGVPGVTQDAVEPGGTFAYEFPAAPAGSYLYHSHYGLQLDRGLTGPLIIEETTPHVAWDLDYTVFLDDYLPGAPRPLAGGMGMGARTPPYEGLLINGKLPAAAPIFRVRNGDRARLRLINGGSATTFRVAITGHRLEVTHADGRPVVPVVVDSVTLGMGERIDVIVTANRPGVWALVAAPLEVQAPAARAVLRYRGALGDGTVGSQVPEGLRGGRQLAIEDLISLELDPGGAQPVDRTIDLRLAGGMMSSAWTINGQAYPDADPIDLHLGERVEFRMFNQSNMRHPMHLHGHFFRVGRALKDTVSVLPMARVSFSFVADNPGNWLFHCHNAYHMEAGMARVVRIA
ncbi:MAG: multicopper oxidase family protein [Thermoanaerobaculia bacterium]